MDFLWIFYAVLLFVAGGTCFFTALTALVRLDQNGRADVNPSPALPVAPPSSDSTPRMTKLGRPVRQIQIL